MPVRDAGPYLDAAIESILAQSISDFEFVIRDDGSIDGTTEALRAWAEREPRIRLTLARESLGPAESSNFVVRASRAKIVARMDADDISDPHRLERQLAVLRDDPGAVLVGALWEGIDHEGRRVRPRDRSRLVRPSPFAPFPHGSIMFRRDAFEAAGGYRREANFWEDADLYRRLSAFGRLLVLPDPLYLHRASALSTRLVSDANEVEHAVDRMYRTLERGMARAERRQPEGKVLPKVFVSLGSTRLWAGCSPEVLGAVWKRGALASDHRTLATLAWAAWGAVSPRSLRFLLRQVVRLRDWRAGRAMEPGAPLEWQPLRFEPPGADSRRV